ncbi:hypothetical protein [Anaerofustis butyriciformans]|uniref:hypothetical protein n=1 Tax=Anaerofustis butyriciformans TaxID=3108533 RepID=UPI002E2F7634|nr:hypothetical protein [Anaerofustis sp. HA2171]
MLNINNEEFVNLKNDNAKMHFDIKENEDFLSITLKITSLPISEYAVVFIMGNREYTAAIFKTEKEKNLQKIINIEKNKVESFNKIEIVDIYSGEILFDYENEKELDIPFFDEKRKESEKNILKEDINIIKEENELMDLNLNNQIKPENEKEEEDEKEDKNSILEKEEQLDILEDLFDIFSNKNEKENNKNINDEKEINQEFEFQDKDEEEDKNKIKKIINANNILIDDVLKNFSLENFTDLDSNYKFYIMDEFEEKLNNINIIYNGFVMPILYPYMGFKNKNLENAILPSWIFGKFFKDEEVKYYIYGVLGSKKDNTQPFMGSTGFIYYEPTVYDGFGYWLMYISVSTGKICLL